MVLPGVPPVGVAVDVSGLLVNMIMLGVALLLMLCQFMGGYVSPASLRRAAPGQGE